MKTIALALLAVAVALPLRAETSKATKTEKFKLIHVADLEAAMKATAVPAIFDANTKSTRKKAGVIPGAKLLSSALKYDVAKELPSDKKTPLVFYCANTMCMASHQAAEKAVDAGYSDVSVMSDGIFGWKDAGKPTEKPGQKLKKS